MNVLACSILALHVLGQVIIPTEEPPTESDPEALAILQTAADEHRALWENAPPLHVEWTAEEFHRERDGSTRTKYLYAESTIQRELGWGTLIELPEARLPSDEERKTGKFVFVNEHHVGYHHQGTPLACQFDRDTQGRITKVGSGYIAICMLYKARYIGYGFGGDSFLPDVAGQNEIVFFADPQEGDNADSKRIQLWTAAGPGRLVQKLLEFKIDPARDFIVEEALSFTRFATPNFGITVEFQERDGWKGWAPKRWREVNYVTTQEGETLEAYRLTAHFERWETIPERDLAKEATWEKAALPEGVKLVRTTAEDPDAPPGE